MLVPRLKLVRGEGYCYVSTRVTVMLVLRLELAQRLNVAG